MILGTAGHIDHGKTALVKALTGVDTDRLPEEKKRGITIDLGFAPLQLEGVGTVGVVDVPGHEGFVRTMLAGSTGINLGLLVVAADEGIMPQTREHLEILRILNVPVPVVALTKADLGDDEWKSLVAAEVRDLVGQRLGEEPEVVAVSSVSGKGIERLREQLAQAFRGLAVNEGDDLFRLPIDRVFTIKGTGTVVSGTIWTGSVSAGDVLELLPSGIEARVRRVESHGSIVDRGHSGSRCAIALSNIAVEEIERGNALVGGPGWRPTSRFAARVQIDEEFLATAKKGRQVQLHIGTTSVSARIRFPLSVETGQSLYAIVATQGPVVARTGDRFVLRSSSPVATIGGGLVLDPFPARGSVKEEVLAAAGPEKLKQLLHFAGSRGVPLSDLPIRLGVPPVECEKIVSGSSGILRNGDQLFLEEIAVLLESRISRILAENEANDPLSRGVSLSTARMATRSGELFDLAVRRMSSVGKVSADGGLLRSSGWAPRLDENSRALAETVLHDICACRREPPSVGELVKTRGSRVPELLRFLEKEGRLVQVETDRYYDVGVVKELLGELRRRMAGGQVYSPADLREFLGISRKYLIPFLEYCDRLGVTERRLEGRMLRAVG